jgi:carnitine O-acetyltransferase
MNVLRLKVADASLPQDNLRGKTPLCASAYKYVFNTCRIPAPTQDVIGIWKAEENNHIVILANNCVYKMDLPAEMTPTEIMAHFAWVKEDAKKHTEVPLGTLTAVHRDTWTTGR